MYELNKQLDLLSRYFGDELRMFEEKAIPEVSSTNGITARGQVCYAKKLIEKSKLNLYGQNLKEKALIDQLLELKITYLDKCASDKEIFPYLKDLNVYIADKVYIAGNHFSVADVMLFYCIHDAFLSMSFSEKQSFQNLSRWFQHIQSNVKVKQNLPSVIFSCMQLY